MPPSPKNQKERNPKKKSQNAIVLTNLGMLGKISEIEGKSLIKLKYQRRPGNLIRIRFQFSLFSPYDILKTDNGNTCLSRWKIKNGVKIEWNRKGLIFT